MRFSWWGVAAWSLSYVVTQAAAAQSASHPGTTHTSNAKHQIIDCMNRRMAASRTLSYNDAARVCKDQLNVERVAQQPSLAASGPPQKAVSAP